MDDRYDVQAHVRDFLATRRARLQPAEVGLPGGDTGRRRVAGLRREEVALLAGISPEYYVRIERGHAGGVSSAIVDAVAHALRLSDTEHAHLLRLLLALDGEQHSRSSPSQSAVRPGLRRLLDGFSALPAFLFNARLDIVATNELGRALYSPLFEVDAGSPPNSALFTFLHEARARELWPEWSAFADHAVAVLRTELGRHPRDRDLAELIDELSSGSAEFRDRWAVHDVADRGHGTKIVNHPVTGSLALPYEIVLVADDPDSHIMVYTPDPGSPEHDALGLLCRGGDHTVHVAG